MKIFVGILQVTLSLWTITGGIYMLGHYEVLASTWAYNALPTAFWIMLGIVQIVCSVGLLISVKEGGLHKFAVPSAITLAIITLGGIILYSGYAGFLGMLWAIIPAALFGFVAYKRKHEVQ